MLKRKKIGVSVLGATGMVGQRFLTLLENHPWFKVIDIAASENSKNKTYKEAVGNRWVLKEEQPKSIEKLILRDVQNFKRIPKEVKIVFSAVDLSNKESTRHFELSYAKKGYAVISTSSASRGKNKIPMIIPEINHHHIKVIKHQQEYYKLPISGFICVKPNCSIQSYMFVLDALTKKSYELDKIQVCTLQALSGAGYKAIKNKSFQNNVIPYIKNEEIKTEEEPLKIFGEIKDKVIKNSEKINISAFCNRVPVIDGHTAIVSISFKGKKPSIKRFKEILESYSSLPQTLELPTAPIKPIYIMEDIDRPQPKIDSIIDKGMALSVGRISKDKFFDIRFVGLSHNTLRGAAGGAILNAELLLKENYI